MPTDPFTGKMLGEFQIQERLGQGAMATVYKAHQPSVNRLVALKVIQLNQGQGVQDDFRQRFAQEAELVARLEHIHILPIFGYGIDSENQAAYIAMRWLKGGSLSDVMKAEPMPLQRAAVIIEQVARGLTHAHQKNVIHRDLKPSNIMLDDAGNAYLTDFGLAKIIESSGELTLSGTIVGTPSYMSPEQLRGDTLDRRSDIYSLGVILYNMVTGQLPFESSSGDIVSVIYQHLEKAPTPPSEFVADLPPKVEQVILKALQKKPADRFDSAEALSRALNQAIGASSIQQTAPTLTDLAVQKTGSSSSKRQTVELVSEKPTPAKAGWGVWIGVAVLLLAIIAAVFLVTNNLNTPNVKLPTILLGESAMTTEFLPTAAEITNAKAMLGTNGLMAYIACSQDSEYHAGLTREISDRASQYGLNFKLYAPVGSNADEQAYNQITLIEKARTDGAKALIVCPLKPDLLADSLTSIAKAHIPLSLFADGMPNYGGVLVGSDNYILGLEPGRFAGQIIRDEMNGQANVVILGYPDREDLVQRANGLADGVKELAPKANIIGVYRGGLPNYGKESIQGLISDGVQFNVIVSINDAGSFGAIQALEEAGITPDQVFIASIDAEAQALEYIRQGNYIRGSLRSSRVEVANGLVDAAVRLMVGATLPEKLIVPAGTMVTKTTLEAGS